MTTYWLVYVDQEGQEQHVAFDVDRIGFTDAFELTWSVDLMPVGFCQDDEHHRELFG